MRRITAPAWSSQDIQDLRNLVQKGASSSRCAVALKRSPDSVRLKAKELGVPFPSMLELKRKQREREALARAAAGLPPA